MQTGKAAAQPALGKLLYLQPDELMCPGHFLSLNMAVTTPFVPWADGWKHLHS